MKIDYKIYNYYATCPICKNNNTKINKALKYEFALCYACGAVFKLQESEIKKFLKPANIEIALHKDLSNLQEIEKKYINNVNNLISNASFEKTNVLDLEMRNFTKSIINDNSGKKILLLSKENFSDIENYVFSINTNDVKEISKNIYKSVLKFGKIDLLIIENIQDLHLIDLFKNIETSFSEKIQIIIYIPDLDKIYLNHYYYIYHSKYIYNTYTLTYCINKTTLNIIDIYRLENFNAYKISRSAIALEDISNKIQKICNQEVKNIIYSEPLFIIS